MTFKHIVKQNYRLSKSGNPTACLTTEASWIHINVVMIRAMPTIHFDQQSTSFVLNPAYIYFSSTAITKSLTACTYFFFFLFHSQTFSWMTWLTSFFNTCPYTQCATASWPTASFKPNIIIKSSTLFQSLSHTLHITFTMDLSILLKTYISHSPISQSALPHIIVSASSTHTRSMSALEETVYHITRQIT